MKDVYEKISDLEHRIRCMEKFQDENISELLMYKRALYYAALNISAIRFEDYAEAEKVALEQMRVYLQKARQCPDVPVVL